MKNRAGLTIIEVMIAVVMLAVGVLAFITTSAATVGMLSRGNRAAKAAFYSQDRLEMLAATPCQLLADGSINRIGAYDMTWTVTTAPGGNSKRVRLISTYPGVRGRTRTDTTEMSVLCIR